MIEGFVPDWPAPANVMSFITCRGGGCSEGVFASGNLATHVGDNPAHVARNRRYLQEVLNLPSEPRWLNQVHSSEVVDATSNAQPDADGVFTSGPGQVCAVLTADCLPILLCNQAGEQVAAIHGGWRGLAKGIIAAAINRFGCPADDLLAYLGPAISGRVYEVGAEVVSAFANLPGPEQGYALINPQRNNHYFLDLYAVARIQLNELGVHAVYGGHDCTYSDSRFYSYRRDGRCGRMASLIWIS